MFDQTYIMYNYDKIEASYNWYQSGSCHVQPVTPGDLVGVSYYDNTIHAETPIPPTMRFFDAIGKERNGVYEEAYNIYKAIVDAPYTEEKKYLSSCLDGMYRLSEIIPVPSTQYLAYLDSTAVAYAVSDTCFFNLLKAYQVKKFVVDKEYQAAIDIIQARIDNPYSSVDSLRAVLDLELVLQMAEHDQAKKPFNTRYTQYQYNNVDVYNDRHEEHWKQLYALMDKDNPNPAIPIPALPTIAGNYPNPFNPSTTISLSIPKSGKASVEIFNIKGQRVRTLVKGNMDKGWHRLVWDGIDNNNKAVSSGVYFVKLTASGKSVIRKVMMLK